MVQVFTDYLYDKIHHIYRYTKNNPFMKNSLTGLILIIAHLFSHSCSVPEEDLIKPNIIFILADDLGFGDLSLYGQDKFTTPHIDQMASAGIVFSNHYAGSTVCGPSRASLLTGLHTGNTSVRGNQPEQILSDDEITIAHKLKEGGYITGKIGKWGVGHPPPVDDPLRKGFDYFYGYVNMWHAHNFYPEFLYRNGKKEYLRGNELMTINGNNPFPSFPEGTGVAEKKEQHTHFLFEQEALSFIEANRDTTFFLFLSLNIPHANNEAGTLLNDGMEVDDYGRFAEMDWPNPEKGFARMVEYMDNTVGAVNNKLKELGLEENTLVILTNDNGPHREGGHDAEFFNSRGGLRGYKRDLYEGGVKVPFIAKWTGAINPGTSSEHISAFWDIMPTFCELAGVTSPTKTDGISFLSALLGDHLKQHKHQYLYWEFYESGGRQAVRMDNWKGLRFETRSGNPTPIELYDLNNDPEESHNVADQNPEVVGKIESIMEKAHTPLTFISLFNDEVSSEMMF
jgi:arylsulfatase A-like enzyme